MRWLKIILKVLGVTVILVAVLLGVAAYLLNTPSFQNRLMRAATTLLSRELGTRVAVDSVHVDVMRQDFEFYGVEIDDQQGRKMLQLQRLEASADLMALRQQQVKVSKVDIRGAQIMMVKDSIDSVANYQFLIDSLKHITSKKEPDKPGKKLSIDIQRLTLEDIHATLHAPTTRQFDLKRLNYSNDLLGHTLDVDSLRFATNNHKPRKNTGKPKRGFFDKGHLDMTINLKADINHLSADSLAATVKRCTASDPVTGIDLNDVRLNLQLNKQVLRVKQVNIRQGSTTLTFDSARLTLPDKQENRVLAYSTSPITGHVILKDISRPFTRVLHRFTMPLILHVRLSGTATSMRFDNIDVATADKRLHIKANGSIANLTDKKRRDIRFRVSHMAAHGGIKEKIIDFFTTKPLMAKPLHALGNIDYSGEFAVLWKKLIFAGTVGSAVGDLRFQFTIDQLRKYLSGQASTQAISVGKTFDLPHIGVAKCYASFGIDISGQHTAPGGKLPVGQVKVQVDNVQYRKLHMRNVTVEVQSDGAVAQGSVRSERRFIDLACDFSFTSTEEMQKMKIYNPGIFFHKDRNNNDKKNKEKKDEKKEKEKKGDKDSKEKKADDKSKEQQSKGNIFKRIFGRKK